MRRRDRDRGNDPEGGDLTFEIVDGDTLDIFKINADTGEVIGCGVEYLKF